MILRAYIICTMQGFLAKSLLFISLTTRNYILRWIGTSDTMRQCGSDNRSLQQPTDCLVKELNKDWLK